MLCQNQNECYYGEYEYKWYNIHFVLIFLPTTYKTFCLLLKKKKSEKKMETNDIVHNGKYLFENHR